MGGTFTDVVRAKVALLTTEGFRDVVEIGRQKRPKLYDLFQDKPSSIVVRRYRFGIEERMGPDDSDLKTLNKDARSRANYEAGLLPV